MSFIEKLRKEIINLPGEKAHIAMLPGKRIRSSEAIKTAKTIKQSAVSIILFEKDSQFNFVLIQRPEYKGIHSKQISFPGGKLDETDNNDVENALRETEEEIGVDRNDLLHLGKLTKIYIPVSCFEVHPHVFYLQNPKPFKKEIREVDEILSIQIKELLNEKNVTQTEIDRGNKMVLKNVPSFILNNKIVWGATAIILNEFKTILKRFL